MTSCSNPPAFNDQLRSWGGINALRCIPDGVITFLGFTALRVVFFSWKGDEWFFDLPDD